MKKLFLETLITLILISMSTSTLSVQSSGINLLYDSSSHNEQVESDLSKDSYLKLSDQYCSEFARLIIGVDSIRLQMRDLEEFIISRGGNVVDTISAQGEICALTVEAPLYDAFFLTEELRANSLVKYVVPDSKVNASFIPNDPYWDLQWGPQKIEADLAWDKMTGSSDILVAIVDSGIDYTHSDLAASYVPLGYDWVNDDADPWDDNGHGTHCAGIVAAQLNNSVGIAGIAQVRIMAEKVLGADGVGYDTWVAQGIYHAVDAGAKIISMSLGGPDESQPMNDAVKYARDHNVLVVASAGNTATPELHYPAAYDECIAVSATDSGDNLAWFSTFGEWVDLSAPGVSVYSTYPGNAYTYMSGTSMSCPHVAGVAALAWSMYPNCSADQIRWVLEHTADDLGEEGFDEFYGHGRVNAKKAVGLPQHDVHIAECQCQSRLDPGKIGKFNVTIANRGWNDEMSVSVQFYVNGTLKSTESIGFLGTFSSVEASFSWGTGTTGDYNLTFYVVPVPSEISTENNAAYCHTIVRFPLVLRVRSQYPTIKAALSYAVEGDTILVSDGYYAEGQIDIRMDNVTLTVDGDVILDGCLNSSVVRISADYVTLTGFNLKNGMNYGILMKSRGSTLTRNTIINVAEGIIVYDSFDCIISLNNVIKSSDGLVLDRCSNNTVNGNKFVMSSFSGGMKLRFSSNNTVSHNMIVGGNAFPLSDAYGGWAIDNGALHLYYSQNNTLVSNNVTGNLFGLIFQASPYNILRNNTIASSEHNFCIKKGEGALGSLSYAFNDVDASNTVNGKPICYWVDVHDKTVPSNAGVVVLVRCNNIKVENLSINNNLDGILLLDTYGTQISRNNITANYGETISGGIVLQYGSSNNTITLNNITFNKQGIWAVGTRNNTISQNTIANNIMWGIVLYNSPNCTVSSNLIANNDSGLDVDGKTNVNNKIVSNSLMSNYRYGIALYGSNHTVSLNNIIANEEGITLVASNCRIISNNIIANKRGAWMYFMAANNVFFHNNFINNTRQVISSGFSSVWDDDYLSGGNYWSDYNGTDLYSGPYQNETGSDGIGDSPCVIDDKNIDRYPLMTPHASNPPPLQMYQLTLSAWVGDTQSDSIFYDTTNPLPGTYLYLPDLTIQVKAIPDFFYSFLDHWELDGVNIGSANPCTVLMNKDHNLKAFFLSVLPLTVSISPMTVKIIIGESVTFASTLSGGKPPYAYQWYLEGSEVFGATSPVWTFKPLTTGTYNVYLNVAYCYWISSNSSKASVTVAPKLTASISQTSASIALGKFIKFTATVSGGYPPYGYQWCLDGNPVQDATSINWTFTPIRCGVYYIHLEIKDDEGNQLRSEVICVTVTRPVGGYSFLIERNTTTRFPTHYLALMAILIMIFATTKRKTTKK